MTFEEATSYLYSLERRGVRLGLDRIVGAFRDHGDPQESFRSVLIAGTNGKGSTSAIVASCLGASGRRAGLFTSPHLLDFRERMRVGGRMIPESAVAEIVGRIRPACEKWELSFFEATTLLAFLWFRDERIEAAAVEVGLGGRLDATRPVDAAVTVVTSIAFDHEKILGSTLGAIAGEKAGIIRAGAPVAVGVRGTEPLAVLRERAILCGAPFFERRRALRVDEIREAARGSAFRLRSRPALPGPPLDLRLHLDLPGLHQIANAALAVLALRLLPDDLRVGDDAIRKGVERVRWPGRMQELPGRPRILLDVGHNPEGAAAIARCLSGDRSGPVRLVLGMVEGKDHRTFIARVGAHASAVHLCTPPTERAVKGEELLSLVESLGLSASVHPDPSSALAAAIAATPPDGAVLVTGSFFTVGAVMAARGIHPTESLWLEEFEGEGS